MSQTSFKSVNYSEALPDLTGPFTISCTSGTDIWDKPPSTHSFNAPILYQCVTLSSFKSAQITVSAAWKRQYDQGGLCLVINPNGESKKWVKTGIELLNGQPYLGTVATDRWSDWSLTPLPKPGAMGATIQIVNEDDGSLWVYAVDEDGEKAPLREVTWWADLPKDVECWIGAYAAKPSRDESTLEVQFENLVIRTQG